MKWDEGKTPVDLKPESKPDPGIRFIGGKR